MVEEIVKPQDELELSAGDKKLRIRGSDILGILQMCVLVLIAYGGWRHDADGAEQNKNVVQALEKQTNVQREQLNAQREANCLNRLTGEQRKQPKEIDFCRELGKGR